MARTLAKAAVALVVLVAAVGSARAQVTTGTVFGTVRDAQGGVIPGVTLVLTSETRGPNPRPS